MTARRVLLVGSMPFSDEETAMKKALAICGEHLMGLPDGEIGVRSEACPKGDRSAWVQTILDRCERDTENWSVRRPARRNEGGYSAGYDSGPLLVPKHTPKAMAQTLRFGWNDAACSSYPISRRLRADAGAEVPFQVGLPTGIGATFGIMSPLGALRYAGAFDQRVAFEANDILQHCEIGDLVFQIEVPGELAMAHRLPSWLVSIAVKRVVNLVQRIEPGAPIGIHLCFGDLNNEALIHAPSLRKAVRFCNALIARWPASHRLSYIHFPLAEAADPPPLERAFYEPLAEIALPAETGFVAGFVHEKRSESEHRQIRDQIEAIRGAPVEIACSCGLGRRDADIAERMMEMCVGLCGD